MAESGLVFRALTGSFPLLALTLCALHFADYALTVWGQKLYLARGREYHVHEHYELNPFWQRDIERQALFSARLAATLALHVALAAMLRWFPALYEWLMFGGSSLDAFLIAFAYGFRDLLVAALLSRSVTLVALHIDNLVVYSRLMRPELISGRITMAAAFSYARARSRMLSATLILGVVAVLQPSTVTLGYALGPLTIMAALRTMQRRHERSVRQAEADQERSAAEAGGASASE